MNTFQHVVVAVGGDFRLHGMWLDEVSGLYHVRARSYDAATGRFLSRDPVSGNDYEPETYGMYGFNRNNPHVWVDPSGQFGLMLPTIITSILRVFAATAFAGAAMIFINNLRNGLREQRELSKTAAPASRPMTGTPRIVDVDGQPIPIEEEPVVPVFHGSLNNASAIRGGGFQIYGGGTPYVSRDIRAAQDAIGSYRRGVEGGAKDPGIIQSDIPESLFDAFLAPFEKPYRGFFPYLLDTTEIPLRGSTERQIYNTFIVR